MSIDIRLPNINGKNDAEQLSQINSYLYQFASQLQWALDTLSAGSGSNAANQMTAQKAAGSASASTDKDDPATTFSELKGLIIKSADIVEAYYEKIDEMLKLSGEYTASSEFGTFKEDTKNLISATDKQIRQDVVSKQSIYDENGNIKAELLVNGHIYSGIIEYAKDGEAIVGIEIGQTTKGTDENGQEVKNFSRFARFTADRLAFYDASYQDEPVAYISNYMLVITNAWVKGSLKIGSGFELDTSNGVALIPV